VDADLANTLQQWSHLPMGGAGLWIAWKLGLSVLKAWKEIALMKLQSAQAEQAGHREEKLALMKGFESVRQAVDENTQACREQTDCLREFMGVVRVRRQG